MNYTTKKSVVCSSNSSSKGVEVCSAASACSYIGEDGRRRTNEEKLFEITEEKSTGSQDPGKEKGLDVKPTVTRVYDRRPQRRQRQSRPQLYNHVKRRPIRDASWSIAYDGLGDRAEEVRRVEAFDGELVGIAHVGVVTLVTCGVKNFNIR
jgi:hypothetical protein